MVENPKTDAEFVKAVSGQSRGGWRDLVLDGWVLPGDMADSDLKGLLQAFIQTHRKIEAIVFELGYEPG